MQLKPIAGFEDYGVSDDGRAWRIAPLLHGTHVGRAVPFEMVCALDKDGYPKLRMFKHGKYTQRAVHRLVLETFGPQRPSELHVVAHNDGSKDNNRIENLRWATYSENERDKFIHGTKATWQNSPNAKLADTDIPFIKTYPQVYGVNGFLASIYGVCKGTIKGIRNGKRYQSLECLT